MAKIQRDSIVFSFFRLNSPNIVEEGDKELNISRIKSINGR